MPALTVSDRNCPSCRVPMVVLEGPGRTPQRHAGGYVTVCWEHCPDCEGAWFDFGAVERLIGVPRAGLWGVVEGPTGRLDCPVCGAGHPSGAEECVRCAVPLRLRCPSDDGLLDEIRILEVPVRMCPGCRGLWLVPGRTKDLDDSYREAFPGQVEPADVPVPFLDFDPWEG